ncbi:hypothetical protein D3C74_255940 [compost metagenome]
MQKKCPSHSVRSELLDSYVWNLIIEVISDPEDYIKRIEMKSTSVIRELELATESIKKQLELKVKGKEKIILMRQLIKEQCRFSYC